METKASLVRTQRRVELDAEAAVDPDLSGIVHPRNAEDDLPLRFAQSLDEGLVQVPGVSGDDRTQAFEDLLSSLMELLVTGVAPNDLAQNGRKLFV
jgi:hypothetical protein